MGRVSGKIALITGAGSGIGRGAALALAAEGATIVATDVDDVGAAQTAALVRDAGGTVVALNQDVVSEARWVEVVTEIAGSLGGLHILVNNAGIGIAASLFDMAHDDWRRQMAINVDGVFFGVKHGAPLIAASGGGSIINISSVAGLRGAPGLAGYSASKGAVRLFTKSAALECAQAGMNVRVNSVHPGIIDTPIWTKVTTRGLDALQASGTAPGANAIDPDVLGARAPLGYAGLPSDVAAGIVFLASEESRYVTGAELVIDGGMMAR